MPKPINETNYNQLWQALVNTQPTKAHEYFFYHKTRYYELFCAMAHYLENLPSPTVLEVGVSGFLPLYKEIFPEINLVTIDRPVELGGANSFYCINECGAERHYNIDLSNNILTEQLGEPPLGKFDFVICTEIIEHLIVNPVEFIASLLSLLSSTGFLYMTTPNFFSYHNIQKLKKGENPQSIFPGIGMNRDHGHHFREYTMGEILNFTRNAKGRIVNASYSDCWDDNGLAEFFSTHPEQKSNLIIVAASQEVDHAQKDSWRDEEDIQPIVWNEQIANSLIFGDKNTEIACLQEKDTEIYHLQKLLNTYKRSRCIRLMNWLRNI